jgi:hypothetical protein
MFTKRDLLNDPRFINASDDEIIFPLYGRDDQAPTRVRDWATQRKADISLGKKPESDMAQVDAAFGCADDMEEWREENDGKWRNGLFAGVDDRP